MKTLFRFWFPVLAYMGFIFYLSSRSTFPIELPLWMIFWDKFLHACLFGFLALLTLRALCRGNWNEVTLGMVFGAVLFSSLYGVTDELHQYFTPERSSDPLDWVADTVGAILAAAAVYLCGSWSWLTSRNQEIVLKEE